MDDGEDDPLLRALETTAKVSCLGLDVRGEAAFDLERPLSAGARILWLAFVAAKVMCLSGVWEPMAL